MEPALPHNLPLILSQEKMWKGNNILLIPRQSCLDTVWFEMSSLSSHILSIFTRLTDTKPTHARSTNHNERVLCCVVGKESGLCHFKDSLMPRHYRAARSNYSFLSNGRMKAEEQSEKWTVYLPHCKRNMKGIPEKSTFMEKVIVLMSKTKKTSTG